MLKEKQYLWSILLGALLLLGLFVTSLYNYLLFHSLIEMFAVVVAFSIFIISWNSRRFIDNDYFVFLGIAYLFVGSIDLVHTLAYKGMGVFAGYNTNLPTQLWISARYYESLSLLIAPYFLRRKLKIDIVLTCFCIMTLLLFFSIFYGKTFPDCFIEGEGLTAFKKVSEYIISAILLASILFLLRNRNQFDQRVLRLLIISIAVTIASELSFTAYKHPYAFANQVGHFLKLLSFYLIYKAIIETGIREPYAVLLRNLKQSKDLVQEERDRVQNYFDVAGSILVIIDADERVNLINKKGCKVLGYTKEEIIGKNWFETFLPERNRNYRKAAFHKLMSGEIEQLQHFENPILAKNGNERIIAWNHTALKGQGGNVIAILASGEDITNRKRGEEALEWAKKELTIRNKIAEIFLTTPDEEMFREVLQVILKAMDSKYGFFGYIDENFVLIIPSITWETWEKCQVPDKTTVFPRKKWSGIWGQALMEKRSLFANEGLQVSAGHIPMTRALAVPVMYAEQPIGLLVVADKPTDYSRKDQEFLETIAGKIAPPLNARLQRDREEKERKQTEKALWKARNELEQRVKERTSELQKANEQLRQKIEELKRIEKALRESESALRKSQDNLRFLAGKLLSVQEEEHRRLARAMHDDLTQRLAVLAIEAGKLERQFASSPGPLRNKLEEMKEQIVKLSADVHDISRQLHPAILDDLGLVDAIRSECASFSKREGIMVKPEPKHIPDAIPKDVALCIYRIMQESLRNIAKHAKVKTAEVLLTGVDNGIQLCVKDDGAGFNPADIHGKGRLGLASMKERARLIQGKLSIQSQPGQGTIIKVWAPLLKGSK